MAVTIAFEQYELLDATAASDSFDASAGVRGSNLTMLVNEATERGYRAVSGSESAIGIRYRVRATAPVAAPEGETGEPVEEVVVEWFMRPLENQSTNGQAAVVSAAIVAGSNSKRYEALVEAQEDDFLRATEQLVVNGEIADAHSWWSVMKECLTDKCGGACVTSLVACTGTWAAYLYCVAAACGLCWGKCVACEACDCSWWCRWGVGCCD